MMLYLLFAIGGFLAIYFLKRKRQTFYALAERSVSVLNDLLTAEDDDDKKLEMLTASTNKLVGSLFLSVGLVAVAAVIFLVPSSLYSWFNAGRLFTPQMGAAWGLVALSVGASIPFFLPAKSYPSGYSELSMLLHRMVLNNYTIGLRLLKREVKTAKKLGLSPQKSFVIVSGLARSGTTSLMNKLMETAHFSSLSYANMPFLLSPNSWARVYKPKTQELKERSHKDGIKIGLESNEALEEYFFKAKLNDRFIQAEGLETHSIFKDELADYLDYQAVVRQHTKGVYLAKNNNFILRYKSVRKLNDAFVFAILYRHPLYHAASLLEKHQQYTAMQQEDGFVLEYMNWLGHHEFGQNQKPFVFNGQKPVKGDKSTLDYWLNVWINYYNYAQNLTHQNTLFICYESYCQFPDSVMNGVLAKVDMPAVTTSKTTFKNQREVRLPYSDDLLSTAMEIYVALGDKT